MADDLPGFIPRVLQLDDVALLRADEAVLNAMVDGWRAQMLARGLAVSTITARCSLIGRFVEFTNEYPWRWRPLDVDQFLAYLRSRETPVELSTLRSYGNAISMFCSYVSGIPAPQPVQPDVEYEHIGSTRALIQLAVGGQPP